VSSHLSQCPRTFPSVLAPQCPRGPYRAASGLIPRACHLNTATALSRREPGWQGLLVHAVAAADSTPPPLSFMLTASLLASSPTPNPRRLTASDQPLSLSVDPQSIQTPQHTSTRPHLTQPALTAPASSRPSRRRTSRQLPRDARTAVSAPPPSPAQPWLSPLKRVSWGSQTSDETGVALSWGTEMP
jgi:hypothetical protein